MEVPSVTAFTNASLHHHPLLYHLPLCLHPLHLQRRRHYCRPVCRTRSPQRRAVAAPPHIQRSRTPAAFLLPLPLSPPLACATAMLFLFLPASLLPNPVRKSARWSGGSLDKQTCSSLTCQEEAPCLLCSSSWRETRRWVWGLFGCPRSLDMFRRSHVSFMTFCRLVRRTDLNRSQRTTFPMNTHWDEVGVAALVQIVQPSFTPVKDLFMVMCLYTCFTPCFLKIPVCMLKWKGFNTKIDTMGVRTCRILSVW